jgi:hypothetical protein
VSHQVRTEGGLDLTVVVPRSAGRYVVGDRVAVGWAPGSVLLLEREPMSAGQQKQER